jgi:GNAT superfamily N-acetyltransferase
MLEPLPPRAVIRKLWIGESRVLAEHLLRLDGEHRRSRFGASVADAYVRRHAALALSADTIVHGFFVDGTLRGAAELRLPRRPCAGQAELAFSVEAQWQSYGIGSALLGRTLLAARNRGIRFLRMTCLADNQRMQQLARKFDAELAFGFGSVTGELKARRATPLSFVRELIADGHGVATALIDRQLRLLRAV